MKRNLAIFSNLLGVAEFERGIYINKSRVARSRPTDYVRLPHLDQIAAYNIGEVPVAVLQPLGALPLSYRLRTASACSGRLLASAIRREYIRDQEFCLWINSVDPIDCNIALSLARYAKFTVFDSSDDLPALEKPESQVEARRRLREVLKVADRVVCVNEHVANGIEHGSKLVFRNCTTFPQLQEPREFHCPPWFPKARNAVYVGYLGSFHEDRVDVRLAEHLYSSCPDYHFLIVGWVSNHLSGLVSRFPNVHHVSEVPNEYLGSVIRAFDAAVIPHMDNEHTKGNDLLKALDFNACEVPIVTTPVSGVDTNDYVAHVASQPEDFVSRVRACVEGRHGLDLKRGVEIARERSWDRQVPRLAEFLELPLRRDVALSFPMMKALQD